MRSSIPISMTKKNISWPVLVGLGVLAGLLNYAAFYPLKLAFLAYIAYVFVFFLIIYPSSRKGIAGLLIYHVVFFLALMWWAYIYHPGSLPGMLGYYALWMLVRFFAVRFAWRQSRRFGFLFIAAVWVLCDFIVGNFELGFPWRTIAYSQSVYLPLIQIADIIGAWGLTFFILLVNAYLFSLVYPIILENGISLQGLKKTGQCLLTRSIFIRLLPVAGVFIFFLAYGFLKMPRYAYPRLCETAGKKLNFALLQPNLDPYKSYFSRRNKLMDFLISETQEAALKGTDVICWSESVVLYFLNMETIPYYRAVRRIDPNFWSSEAMLLIENLKKLSCQVRAHILIGSLWRKASILANDDYYNAYTHFDRQGRMSEPYFKMHLVPFGEHLPLKRFLFFIEKFLPKNFLSAFKKGQKDVIFNIDGARVATVICFEGVFDDLVRMKSEKGAFVLMNPSNEAWTYRHESLFQHFAFYIFRAVENRIFVARAANTGVTAFVGPDGRVIRSLPIDTRGVLKAALPVKVFPSFYKKRGNIVFGYSMAAAFLIFFLFLLKNLCTFFINLRLTK